MNERRQTKEPHCEEAQKERPDYLEDYTPRTPIGVEKRDTQSSTNPRQMWQPRFYLVCAVSTTIITITVYLSASSGWWGGLAVGFGMAGAFACIFLAVQHWALRGPNEIGVGEGNE